jgi:hypothetical protein
MKSFIYDPPSLHYRVKNMTVLKPQVVLAGLLSNAVERKVASLAGMQLVQKGRVSWTAKPYWIRNMPITAVNPSDAQLLIRQEFARLAKEARASGQTGTKEKGFKEYKGMLLPGAAAYIGQNLSGIGDKVKNYTYEGKGLPYPSQVWRTYHTYAHLEAEIKRRGLNPVHSFIGETATAPSGGRKKSK